LIQQINKINNSSLSSLVQSDERRGQLRSASRKYFCRGFQLSSRTFFLWIGKFELLGALEFMFYSICVFGELKHLLIKIDQSPSSARFLNSNEDKGTEAN
jgi:hypothetical protein